MHRAVIALLLSVPVGFASAACTEPKSADDGDGDGDGDSDSDTDSGSGCGIEFEEAAPGTSGTFTLRNDRDVAIYVPQSITDCTWEAWQVFDGDTQVYWNDAYVPTCTEMVANECSWGCSDGPATAIKLEPGATWTEAWGYYVYAPVELTAGCVDGTMCEEGFTCWAGRTKLEGPLSTRIRVTETCDFGDACTCDGDACLVTADSLSIGGVDAEIVEIAFDAGEADVLLAIQ